MEARLTFWARRNGGELFKVATALDGGRAYTDLCDAVLIHTITQHYHYPTLPLPGRTASNLVFLLKSIVQSRHAVSTHKYTASCYDMTPIDVR